MSEIAQVELLPCPFCGNDDLLISEKPSGDKSIMWFIVHHAPERECGMSLLHISRVSLINHWNSRASISLGAARDILDKSKEKIDDLESQLSLYKQKCESQDQKIKALELYATADTRQQKETFNKWLTNANEALNAFNEQHKEIK